MSEYLVRILRLAVWWAGGADVATMKKIGDHPGLGFRLALGMSVLMTSAVATIAGGMAIYVCTHLTALAIAGGIAWGGAMLTIDRLILAVTFPGQGPKQRLVIGGSRVAVAVLGGALTAWFFTLSLFSTGVAAVIEQEHIRVDQANEQQADRAFPRIEQLVQEQRFLRDEIRVKEQKVDSAFENAQAEGLGLHPSQAFSGKIGEGPLFRQRTARLDMQRSELGALRARNQLRLEAAHTEELRLRSERTATVAHMRATNEMNTGLAAQLSGLNTLMEANPTIHLVHLLLLCCLVMIDVAPVVAKVIHSERDEHDEALTRYRAVAAALHRTRTEFDIEKLMVSNTIRLRLLGEAVTELTNSPRLARARRRTVDSLIATAIADMQKEERLARKTKSPFAGRPANAWKRARRAFGEELRTAHHTRAMADRQVRNIREHARAR